MADADADAAAPADASMEDATLPPPDAAAGEEACAAVRVITRGIDLNVRAMPSLDAEVVASLPEGAVVEVMTTAVGDAVEGVTDWFQVRVGGTSGWVTAFWVQCLSASSIADNPRGLVPFDGFRLPFRCGKTVRVSQGNNTSFSHQGRSRFAYDFAVDRGTRLFAMAPGRVVDAESGTRPGDACYDGGGPECRDYANYVRIRHSDGSITAYWHLNRALVGRGDRVAMGDLIARSGNSGYSTGPHTHVVREENCGYIACQSIRLRFLDVGGDGQPDTGDRVTSGNCPGVL
jgi:hypothetical protein